MKIVLQDVSLHFAGRSVLSQVNLTLEPGRIVGLIGPNGAGKSTLLRTMNGAYPDFSGQIRIGDEELPSLSALERARRITYVGAELETDFPLTVEEYVALGAFSLSTAASVRLGEVMDETGCTENRSRALPELSSGERQRAHLARALFQGSKWICLDESFSRLDLHHQARFGSLLKRYVTRGISFLFVSHDLNFTSDWADRCVLIRDGKVLAEGPTAVTVNAENLRRLYPDAEIILTPHPVSGAMKVYFRG